MKIRCIYNTGEGLKDYENNVLKKNELGRFGATAQTNFGLTIGKEYMVMGLVIFATYQAYLIDDNGLISACPCQLFESMDDKLGSNWHYRIIDKEEEIYPFIQVILGYPELCSDKRAYENLIVEKEEDSEQIYFRRKIELEKELEEKG